MKNKRHFTESAIIKKKKNWIDTRKVNYLTHTTHLKLLNTTLNKSITLKL